MENRNRPYKLIKVQGAKTMNYDKTSIINPEEDAYSILNDCEQCNELSDCYILIDSLVQDILTLEEEMVRWRQALLKYLSPLDAQNLLSDIFDNLARRNIDSEAYQKYIKLAGYKEDPMESAKHTELLWRLRNGTDETSISL